MKKMAIVSTLIAMLYFSQEIFSAPLNADDFLPPVQATTPEAEKAATTVQQP